MSRAALLPSVLALWLTLSIGPDTATAAAIPLAIAEPRRSTPVDFEREILPSLRRSCLACHNQTRAKGDLILETPAAILRGGASGPAVIPGKGAESLLLKASAHQVDDLVMPPVGNKSNADNLTPAELGLLRLWIDQGAQGELRSGKDIAWRAIPTHWISSFAVALSRDGRLAACARANRVQVYHLPSGLSAGRLADAALDGASQTDLVNALAFAPDDGDTLASAGFREVRLWKRDPVQIQPLGGVDDEPWSQASFSPDGRLCALVNRQGDIRLRRTSDGQPIRLWPGRVPPPALLAFSPDGSRVASLGADRVLAVLSLVGTNTAPAVTLDQPAGLLTWFDGGRQLATVAADSRSVLTWRLDASSDGPDRLEPGPGWTAHDAPITALAAEPGPTGRLITADRAGTVSAWPSNPAVPPISVTLSNAPSALLVRSGVVAVVAGGFVSIDLGPTPTAHSPIIGDPREVRVEARLVQDRSLADLERAGAEKAAAEARTEIQKAGETLAKTREKRDGFAKALAEKQQALDQRRQAEAAALKGRDDLDAELRRFRDDALAAAAAADQARAAHRDLADRALSARALAEQATSLHSDLDRLASSLENRGAEPSAIAKAREAAEAAAATARQRSVQSDDARDAANKAVDDLAERSRLVGLAQAKAEQAEKDLPPRRQQAEERLGAARKDIADQTPAWEKARITLEGGERDVELAERAVHRAEQSLAEAEAAAAIAGRRLAVADGDLERSRARLAASRARALLVAARSPSGRDLFTLDAEGAAIVWHLPSSSDRESFRIDGPTPLAAAFLDDDTVIVARPHGLARIDLRRTWTRTLTFGGSPDPQPAGAANFVDRVNALAFSPDGTLLATGGGEPSRSGELKLWRTKDGGLERDLGAIHSDCVLALAFSPRGEWLATGGADRFVRLVETATGRRVRDFEGHTHHVLGVAWLAHGGRLASAGAEGTVKLWNPRSDDRAKNVEGFGKEVTGLQSIGLSNQFVAVAGTGSGRIFRDDGSKVRDLATIPAYHQALAISADGRWAATGADDGILRLWDLETGKEWLALPPDPAPEGQADLGRPGNGRG